MEAPSELCEWTTVAPLDTYLAKWLQAVGYLVF